MVILSVSNLYKKFLNPDFVAVNGISFDLQQGQILGFLGPNGAGKTTTIQMLLSTMSPTSGDIVYFGKNLHSHRSEILAKVGFASTYVSLPGKLTVYENLMFYGELYGVPKTILKELQPMFFSKLSKQDGSKWIEIFKILTQAVQEKQSYECSGSTQNNGPST